MVHAPGCARRRAELRSAVRVIELAAMMDRVITGGHVGSADGAGTRAGAAAKVVPVPVQELGRTGWDAPPPAAFAPWIGFRRRHGLAGVPIAVDGGAERGVDLEQLVAPRDFEDPQQVRVRQDQRQRPARAL